MSMKNSSDTIGNRSRDLPVCGALSQPLRHDLAVVQMLKERSSYVECTERQPYPSSDVSKIQRYRSNVTCGVADRMPDLSRYKRYVRVSTNQ
jgi:hypothetical protein